MSVSQVLLFTITSVYHVAQGSVATDLWVGDGLHSSAVHSSERSIQIVLHLPEFYSKKNFFIYCCNVYFITISDKVGRPPGELEVSKSMECDIFPCSALTLLVG